MKVVIFTVLMYFIFTPVYAFSKPEKITIDNPVKIAAVFQVLMERAQILEDTSVTSYFFGLSIAGISVKSITIQRNGKSYSSEIDLIDSKGESIDSVIPYLSSLYTTKNQLFLILKKINDG